MDDGKITIELTSAQLCAAADALDDQPTILDKNQSGALDAIRTALAEHHRKTARDELALPWGLSTFWHDTKCASVKDAKGIAIAAGGTQAQRTLIAAAPGLAGYIERNLGSDQWPNNEGRALLEAAGWLHGK